MKSIQWGGAVLLVMASACGGSSVQGNPQSVGASPSLNITVTGGGGAVTSPDGTFNCAGTCSKGTAIGAVIHLDAAPLAGMQFMGWSGACFGTGGCDLTIAGDTAVGAAFAAQSQGPLTIEVEMDGAGSGSVVSSPVGINCPAFCSMQVMPGTIVTLTSTAGATSRFEGYGGATCHGFSCTFAASGAAKIFANFSSTIITAKHTLTVTAAGDGAIVSDPAGITCPGTCSASFQESAKVVLVATAASGSTFTGWSGACTGTGDCSIALGSDAAATATFAAADPCAGLVPAALPAPTITQVPAFDVDPHACGFALADKAGNIYLRTGYDLSDNLGLNVPYFPFVTLDQGIVASELTMAPGGSVTAFAPDGTTLANAPNRGVAGARANGGIVSVEADCSVRTNAQVTRIDGDGKLMDVVTLEGQPCMTFTASASFETAMDAQEHLLLAADAASSNDPAVPAGHFGARWFDSAGAPLSGWFDLGAVASVIPLTGGGFALNVNGSWTGTLASGKTTVGPPPAGFRANTNKADLVLGGKAYAVYSYDGNITTASGAIDIVEPGGKVCGTITPPGTYNLGGDGSILTTQDARDPDTNLCPVTVYPAVFK